MIYGAGMDKNFNVVHKRAVNATERDELRGSKYVQSDMHNAYRLACEDLKAGRLVLFTGTPCQVDGIKALCPKGCKFHFILYEACGSRMLKNVLTDFHRYVQMARRMSVKVENRAEKSIREHSQILAAIRDQDEDRAERLMEEHIHHVVLNLHLEEI